MNVSVIIPCFNAELYLAQTIGSVLDQTVPPREVVIVDDGSSDRSLEIASGFEQRMPQIVRVFSERSGSASRTRNLGALAASGEALMFLDADDVLHPDTLQALTQALSRERSGVAACPWFRLEQIDSRWIKRPPSCAARRNGEDALSAWLQGWYHPPCSVLWSRSAFERAGRWDERWNPNDDGDLMMRALAMGTPLLETTGGAGFYRRLESGEQSLSSARFSAEGLRARLWTVRKIAAWLEEYRRLERYRRAIVEAMGRIAADARGDHPHIEREALDLARLFRPPLWQRVMRRLRPRRLARRAPVHDPSADAQHEIRFGIERAAQVAAAPAPVDASAAHPRQPESPAVSVVIPTYNRADLLRRALESVLAQSVSDFEAIVVDDGSTDGTESVVARYSDPRVRYLRQVNSGVSAARNHGMRAARGRFIAFLDSDDEWLPQKLAAQVALLDCRSDNVALVFTGVETVHHDGTISTECSPARGDVYRELLLKNVIHGGGSNVMIRREVVATAGFMDEKIPAIEDYDYWLRVARFFEVDHVAQALVRVHDPRGIARRSLALEANLDARWWFYRKHAAAMRREGVAEQFLFESIRRALMGPEPDVRWARRLALRAVNECPGSRAAWGMLRRLLLHPSASQAGFSQLMDQRPVSGSRGAA